MSRPLFDLNSSGENRLWGALGYFFFFVPLIANRSSRFYRFCANQGLLIWLTKLAFAIVFGILGRLLGWVPLVAGVIYLAERLVDLFIILAMLYYGFKAWSGKPETLPVIGRIELLR